MTGASATGSGVEGFAAAASAFLDFFFAWPLAGGDEVGTEDSRDLEDEEGADSGTFSAAILAWFCKCCQCLLICGNLFSSSFNRASLKLPHRGREKYRRVLERTTGSSRLRKVFTRKWM